MTLRGQDRLLAEGVVKTVVGEVRLTAVYERVSSDDQRERETIKTQTESIERYLANHPELKLFHRYQDDGVSGSVPLAERPAGRRLIEDALAGRFHVLLVTRADRLGRDVIDLMQCRALLERFNIEIVGVLEPMDDEFGFDMLAVMAKHERKRLLKRSAEGMNRAAREGRYTGGIVPLGYQLEERGKHLYYVPSDAPMWNGLTEADVARRIFQRLGSDGWSCAQVAMEFHTLGIPTVYQKDRRGIRGKATQALWRPNRIYCLATNTIYRGELRYGLHTRRPGGREIISAEVPRLVSDELWYAAQGSLHANRRNPLGKRSIYLLRSLMVCDRCGRKYAGGSYADRKPEYRCGGQVSNLPGVERCQGKTIQCHAIDEPICADIERWLRDPGDILNELAEEASAAAGADAVVEAERLMYEATLRDLEQQRRRAQDLHIRGGMSATEFDDTLARIETERRFVQQKLELFSTSTVPSVSIDLLAEIRAKLDTGLSAAQWQELAGLLVNEVRVKTEVITPRAKRATVAIRYHFPCVVESHTGSRCRLSLP